MYINMMGEMFDVTFSVYENDTLFHQTRMTAPRIMIESQFIDYVNQLVRAKPRRLKVVLSREEIIWDQFEQRQRILPLTVEFQNYED